MLYIGRQTDYPPSVFPFCPPARNPHKEDRDEEGPEGRRRQRGEMEISLPPLDLRIQLQGRMSGALRTKLQQVCCEVADMRGRIESFNFTLNESAANI